MDEVIPNLWIGNLASAIFNKNKLEEHNIRSVVSAMKGEVSMHDVSPIVLIHIHPNVIS